MISRAAAARRAAGVVVSRPIELDGDQDAFVIEVADTTVALQDLAQVRAARVGSKGRGNYRQRR